MDGLRRDDGIDHGKFVLPLTDDVATTLTGRSLKEVIFPSEKLIAWEKDPLRLPYGFPISTDVHYRTLHKFRLPPVPCQYVPFKKTEGANLLCFILN